MPIFIYKNFILKRLGLRCGRQCCTMNCATLSATDPIHGENTPKRRGGIGELGERYMETKNKCSFLEDEVPDTKTKEALPHKKANTTTNKDLNLLTCKVKMQLD